MSQLTEQYKLETGEAAMYRKDSSDYHTLRYVNWLEAKVANLHAPNSESAQCMCKAHFRIVSKCFCGKCGGVIVG